MKVLFFFFACLIAVSQAVTCTSSQTKIIVRRTYQGYSSQESFEIYQGTSSTGTLVLSANGANNDNKVVNYEVCLSSAVHTFVAIDGNNDGWANSSIFEVLNEADSILLAGTLDRYSRAEFTFYPTSLVGPASQWKYTNQVQSGTTWTQPSFADSTWTSYAPGTFPAVSTTTRYYRTTVNFPSSLTYDKFAGYEIGAFTSQGVAIYVNGKEVYRNNLAAGATGATAATGSDAADSYKIIGGLTISDMASTSVTIAIEIHTFTAATGDDTFKGYLTLLYGPCVYRTHGGVPSSNHPNDWSSQQMIKLWDHDLQTAWYFNNVPAYNQYTFNNNRRELITKYVVRCSQWGQARDPKTWELLGSNDGNTWTRIDYQEGVTFLTRRIPYVIELPNNKVAYNMLRFNVIAVYSKLEGEISEVEFHTCNTARLDDTLKYSQAAYSFTTNLEPIDILPYTTGFTGFTINPALSAGLTFNTNTGRISGTPTIASTASYTITASYSATSAQSTFNLNLIISDCPATSVRVDFQKVTARTGNGGAETWILYDKNNGQLFTHVGTNSDSAATVTETKKMCLPASWYKIDALDDYSTGWSPASYLTVTLYYRTFTYPVTRLILRDKLKESYYVNLGFVSQTSTQALIGTQPSTDWKSVTMSTPGAWTAYDWSAPPSATVSQSVWYFRTQFTVTANDLVNGQAFEYRFRVRAGAVIYLDGEEIYRMNVPEGEVTPTTVATSGRGITEDAWWRSVSGNLSKIGAGTHVFATAVVHKTGFAAHAVDYDSNLRVLMDSDKISHTWRVTASQSTYCYDGNKADKMFDGLYTTTFVAYFDDAHPAPRYGQGNFYEWRTEMINKYCVVSGYDGPQYDPKSWILKGSNDGTIFDSLDTVNNVIWNYRKQSICFYIPGQTKAYNIYRFEVTELVTPNPDNDRFVIGQLEFYAIDYSKISVPALDYTTKNIIGYIGAQLSSSSPTSEYYHSFSITPALPTGIYLNSGTGNIYGLPSAAASGSYTITATGPTGAATTTITLSITACSGTNVLFSLTFSDMGSVSTQNGFEIYRPDNTLLDSYAQFPGAMLTWYTSYCAPVGLYKLILKDGPNDGWDGGKVTVRDSDSNTLLEATCNYGEAPKTVYVNLSYMVHPKTTAWKYTSTVPAANWNTNAFSDASWSSAVSGSFIGLSGVTQYYRTTFTATSITYFAFYELTMYTQSGIAAYINGKLVYSYNLPATFTSETTAINPSTEIKTLITSNSVKFGDIVADSTNVLAIELHKYSSASVDTAFRASLIFQIPSENRIVDGTASSNYRGLDSDNYKEIFTNAFDGLTSTKYFSNVCGNNTYLQWTFNNNRREYINTYSVTRGNNADRLVTDFILYGSNDGTTFTVLDTRVGVTFGAFNTAAGKLTFDFFTKNAYNAYRLELFNSNCKSGYEVSEFTIGSKIIDTYCPSQYGYPDTLTGARGSKSCANWYSGSIYRECVGSTWSNEVIDCTLAAPKPIIYSAKVFVFYTNQYSATPAPIVQAAEAKVEVANGSVLPNGLSIDEHSGIISGTAKTVTNSTDITIVTSNSVGSAQGTITISVAQGATMSAGYIVLIVVAAIIVVAFICVIVFCFVHRSKGKKSSHKKLEKNNTKSSSKKEGDKKIRV